MKKIVSILLLLGILFFTNASLALEVPGPRSTIYNENITKAIDTSDIDNPLRDGSYMIIDNEKTIQTNDSRPGYSSTREVGGIVNVGQITAHNEAKQNVLTIIKNIINYALGLLSFVALLYLIAHGFMMVTAAGDDEKYKKGLKGIKYATIALIGIGISFFLMSFIFWLVNRITLGANG